MSVFASLGGMTSPQATTGRPLRRDAERNRERILTAAREAFAEEGLEVGLHEIARRAGVGVGTVYRRFAGKEALVEALFEDRVVEVVESAERALAGDDAWTALTTFLETVCGLQAADRGLHQALFSSEHGPRCAVGARQRIAPLVGQLVERAQEQGTLRGDVGAFDIAMVRGMLARLIDGAGDGADEVWPRMLAIVLDGLRAERGAPSPLPGRTPSPDMFDRVVLQRRA